MTCGHSQADPCDRTCPECGADLRDPEEVEGRPITLTRCVGDGTEGAGCGFIGGQAGTNCPECGGMIMDQAGLARADELAETWASAADAALHPTGRCECHGEGTCPWCVDVKRRELEADLQEVLAPFRDQEEVDREEVTAAMAKVLRHHLPPVEDPASMMETTVDDDGTVHAVLRVPGWAAVSMGLAEPEERLVFKADLTEEDLAKLRPVEEGEAGPAVEPVEVRTSEEAAEVFGPSPLQALTAADMASMVEAGRDRRPQSLVDLVDHVESKIAEEGLDARAGETVKDWLQEEGVQVLTVTDADGMAESVRTHPVMTFHGPTPPIFDSTYQGVPAAEVTMRLGAKATEDMAEWMAEVAGPVEAPPWTWPDGATGLRLEMAADVEVVDGRLVTPEGGVQSRFVDPEGVAPGTMELVCPSRTWTLTGVYPKGRSWPEDLADAAIGLQPLRWDIHPSGEPRPSIDRPDLELADLPRTEPLAVGWNGPGATEVGPEAEASLVWPDCRECGDTAAVAHYYMGDDGVPAVTVYCGPCATDLDGVDWLDGPVTECQRCGGTGAEEGGSHPVTGAVEWLKCCGCDGRGFVREEVE